MLNKLIILTALWFLCIAVNLHAEGEEILIVRGNENYYPQEMIVKDKLSGLHIDMIQAVAEELDIKVSYKSQPWNRAQAMIRNGKADAISYISKTKEREQYLIFKEDNILSTVKLGFIVLKSREKEIAYDGKLESLKSFIIGTQVGYIYGKKFDEAHVLQKHEVVGKDQLIKMLQLGRVDMALMEYSVFLSLKNKYDLNDFVFMEPAIRDMPVYLAFFRTLKHDNTARKFGKGIKLFKQSKDYQKILRKYNLIE